jgi:hypothetical protein
MYDPSYGNLAPATSGLGRTMFSGDYGRFPLAPDFNILFCSFPMTQFVHRANFQ